MGAAMIVLNGVVGAGIFALPGRLYADFGAWSPWLFPAFGVGVLLIAVPLASLAARFPETGGPVAYAREAFGPFAAFEVGATYYVARMAAFAANAAVFADYAAKLAPGAAEGWGRAAIILALTGLLTALNVVGVKRAVVALDALSLLKIAPLLFIATLAAASGAPEPPDAPDAEELGPAALLVLYAFVGFEAALIPAGETQGAQRTIPRALIATLAATILIYAFVQYGYAAVHPPASEAPLFALGETLMGAPGAALILFAALVSIAGNLQSIMIVAPRVTYALAAAGSLPAWFGAVHTRYATPANSILVMGAGAALLALTGTFVELAVMSTLARLLVYLASLAALPIIRRKRNEPPRRGAAALAFNAVHIVGAVFCVWAVAQSTLAAWRVLGILLIAGAALFALARARRA